MLTFDYITGETKLTVTSFEYALYKTTQDNGISDYCYKKSSWLNMYQVTCPQAGHKGRVWLKSTLFFFFKEFLSIWKAQIENLCCFLLKQKSATTWDEAQLIWWMTGKKSRSFHLSSPNKQVSCGTTHLSQIKCGVSTMPLSFKRK